MPFNQKDFMKGVNANISKINTNTKTSTPVTTQTLRKIMEKKQIERINELTKEWVSEGLHTMNKYMKPLPKKIVPMKNITPKNKQFVDDRTGSITNAPSPAERARMKD